MARTSIEQAANDIRLMINSPRKIIGLGGHGLNVVERVPIEMPALGTNIHYLGTTREKLGNLLVAC